MPAEDAIKATVDELQKALFAKNIIGEPIEVEDKIIIPVTKMGMGFGTGIRHEGKGNSMSGIAGEAGGGVGIYPVAVVIVAKGISGPEGVQVVPLKAPTNSPVDTAVDLSHILLEGLADYQERREKRSENTTKINVE